MTLVPNETEQALNRQYDVYAAAREEYRKKIEGLAAENERLRAALWDIHAICNNGPFVGAKRIRATARAALGEK